MITDTIEYIQERSENIAAYSDKLRQAIRSIDDELEFSFALAGLEFVNRDRNIFNFYEEFIDKDVKHFLAVKKGHCINPPNAWGIFLVASEDHIADEWIVSASRPKLKKAVPHLIEFLGMYAEVLKQKELEYEDIAKKAEAMAEAIKGQ